MRSRQSSPVVMLSFDSLDLDLVRRWASEGLLPNFAEVLKQSTFSEVVNPAGFEAGTVWMSLMTGVTPDHHGVYDACYRFDPKGYGIELAGPRETGVPYIWSRMSRAGSRVAVVDVPYSFLDMDVNGLQVADWLVHVSTDLSGPKSNDSAVLRRLLSSYGRNPIEGGGNRCPINEQDAHSADGMRAILAAEEMRIAWKSALCKKLLSEGGWDFLLAVFHEAHDVGHMCWHVHDEEHEWHDAAVAQEVGDPLLQVYRWLDRGVGELLELAPSEATILLYSSHGIGPERTATRVLDELLYRLELFQNPTAGSHWLDPVSSLYRSIFPDVLRTKLAPSAVMKTLYAKREHDRLFHRNALAVSPSYATGGIHLNMVGRESHGKVPKSSAEAFMLELEQEFLAMENAETGEPLVESVTRTSSLYSGPQTRLLPDMLLEWNKASPIQRIFAPRLGQVINNAPTLRSGDHFLAKNGFLCATGRGLEQGQKEPIHITDLAASLVALTGANDVGLSGVPVNWLIRGTAIKAD